MKIKSEKTSSSKGNVVILNDTSLPKRSTSSSPNKKDVRVVSIKNNNNVDSKKQDHYVMRSVKNETSELSEGDSIAFVLAEEDDGNVVIQNLDNAEAAAVDEELNLSGEEQEHDEEDDDNADVKEIVEHVCGKCFKTFRRIKGLKKHLDFCRIDSGYHIRKAEMLKNLDKIEKDAVTMENKDICFCCGESYDTFHLGHINCPDCPKSFKSQFSYERHIFITHSENNDYPCSVCNAKLRSRKLLELHEEQHKNRGKPFACKVCGREFTRPYHLKRHQKYSTCSTDSSSAVSCNVCDKVFYRLDNLRAHLKQHLGTQVNKKPEYTCPICKNCFYSLSTLNIHTRTHTGEKPFECDLCNKKFPVLVALKKHRRYHTGEKPYTCSVCNQSFAVKEVLNRHMKRHTGEKPHKCGECGKCFIQATQLRNHSKTHFRPFSCDVCSETFKTNKSLERHMRVHSARRRTVKQEINSTNENGNTSEVSANATAAENGAKETPTTASKVVKRKPRVKKRTDCAVCDKSFKDVRSLQFHILKVHEVDPDDFVNEKPKTAMKTSATKRSREQASKKGTDKAQEGPSAKICKVEKSNNQTLVFSSNDDGTIGTIDDDGPVITNVKTICSGLVTVSDNITTTDTDGGLVVKEYIVDELPSSTDNGDTIIYHNDSYTVIPIDTYTTIDTTPVKETKAKPASKTVSGSGGSTTSVTRSAKEKQRSSLGASLAAAIADIPDMEVDEDIDDEEQDDDEKPTEEDIKLKNNVNKLIDMLVDAETLKKFGWPNASEEETLCKVIENCGHDTSKDAQCYKELDFGSRMREYVKLLFTVVIPNESIKELLNNYPIDEVIEFVLGNEEDDDDAEDFEEVDRKPATMENKKESASLLKA